MKETYILTIIILIISTIILLLVLNCKKEKYQPNINDNLNNLIYQDIPQDMSNIVGDVFMFQILPNLTLEELNKIYTINREKKDQIDQFIRRYYGVPGRLVQLNEMIKIRIPYEIQTFEDLTNFANINQYNLRISSLFLRDKFGVNNLEEFENLEVWRYGGDNETIYTEENPKRRLAYEFLLQLLASLFTSLGAKFVRLRQTEDERKILFVDYSNLRPRVFTYLNDVDIDVQREVLRSSPFVFYIHNNGLITFVRDLNSPVAINFWNLINPIINESIILKNNTPMIANLRRPIQFRTSPSTFGDHFNLPAGIPYYHINFGYFLLGSNKATEIYEGLRNINFIS